MFFVIFAQLAQHMQPDHHVAEHNLVGLSDSSKGEPLDLT